MCFLRKKIYFPSKSSKSFSFSIPLPNASIIRCILGGFHVLAAYFALQQMPLSVRVMILSLKPVFTIIFERIFLKVPIGFIEV